MHTWVSVDIAQLAYVADHEIPDIIEQYRSVVDRVRAAESASGSAFAKSSFGSAFSGMPGMMDAFTGFAQGQKWRSSCGGFTAVVETSIERLERLASALKTCAQNYREAEDQATHELDEIFADIEELD